MKIDEEIIKRYIELYMFKYEEKFIDKIIESMRIEQKRHDEFVLLFQKS